MKCIWCGSTEELKIVGGSSHFCRLCRNLRLKLYYDKVRDKVFRYYGNKCACCGEDNQLFLTIDHVNNDGYAEVNKAGRRLGGRVFYPKIIKRGYPDIYQLLCMNCNFGKRMNKGVCPHKI